MLLRHKTQRAVMGIWRHPEGSTIDETVIICSCEGWKKRLFLPTSKAKINSSLQWAHSLHMSCVAVGAAMSVHRARLEEAAGEVLGQVTSHRMGTGVPRAAVPLGRNSALKSTCKLGLLWLRVLGVILNECPEGL